MSYLGIFCVVTMKQRCLDYLGSIEVIPVSSKDFSNTHVVAEHCNFIDVRVASINSIRYDYYIIAD